MNLVIVTGEGRSPAWADDACHDWGRRIGRSFPVQFREKTPKATPRMRVIALDERGEERTSEQFAVVLEEAIRVAAEPLVFVIGGPSGLDSEVRARAWMTLRLSTLVLNHAVARVVLLEQLYRAVQIRAGRPYHHGGRPGG